MKTRWKPGDVALLTATKTGESAIGVRSRSSDCHSWQHSGRFGAGAAYDNIGGFDVRPLVVIDPEDREQVERLAQAWCEQFSGRGAPLQPEETWHMQQALRSLVADPKPDEPQGLGAVVEDADGVRHVRAGLTHDGRMEDCWRQLSGDRVGYWSRWADIPAARVLSEGWSE